MKLLHKALALILTLAVIYGVFPPFVMTVRAESMPVNIYIKDCSDGTQTFRWDAVAGAKSARITYHAPDSTLKEADGDPTTNTFTLTNLKNDHIFDISLHVYDGTDCKGNEIATGFLYYLPRMTFTVTQLKQGYTDMPDGGRETGTKPGLNLKWRMPKVFNGIDEEDTGNYVPANTALSIMQQRLNNVYPGQQRTIGSMNFKINISTNDKDLNSGSSQASIEINYDNSSGSPAFIANVSGINTDKATVRGPDTNGFMDFDLIGRKDIASDLPTVTAPSALRDKDILPGTVYYMNIKPIFKDKSVPGQNVSVLTAGSPDDRNGSSISGMMPYTYTPVRFQLTKDAANNLYVKIFKINQGSLDLPRLRYQVQVSDDGTISGDWLPPKKTLDDSYFSGDFALTVITKVNTNVEMFYKIVVVTDDPNDRLESPALPYTLSADTSKPPVPMNVKIEKREFVTGTLNGKVEKSTDVTISWDKPLNWDAIKANTDPNNDIVYHFQINTSQQNLTEVNYASSKSVVAYDPLNPNDIYIREDGNRFEFTIRGFSLFTGCYWSTNDGSGNPVFSLDDANPPGISKPDDYPDDILLPNKIYYLQMYATKGTNTANMSDKSLVTTFTTLSGTERDVPVVKNFRVNQNKAVVVKDPTTGAVTVSNSVELQFDKINIDWKYYANNLSGNSIYYDLYMSTSPDTDFTLIGSTNKATDPGNVKFAGTDDKSTYITALVQDFTQPSVGREVFGAKLRPNTTYYFYVKTRLVISNPAGQRISMPTSLLPVTTATGNAGSPDTSNRIPLSPADFKIAVDGSGNPLVTGTSAVFEWGKQESGVEYEIICTTSRVDPDAGYEEYKDDPYYRSFTAKYGNEDGKVYLDPADLTDGFSYSSSSKKYTFKTDGWLTPNKLYYFSLRSRYLSSGKESVWVSVPLTTYLIEAPDGIEAVNDCELGFYWTDNDALAEAEDFRVMLKGPEDNDYKALTRSGCSVTKDGNVFYGRIPGLKPNSPYNIRVFKGAKTLVYEKTGYYTRDSYHQVEVRWKGRSGYTYEIAIKAADDDDYTILTISDVENSSYYNEKTALTAGTDYSYYYAKINTVEVSIAGGKVHRPLRSNTKYYVKVRAVKETPSKYAGPVETRTEYSKEDYDNSDKETQQKAVFTDKVSTLEEGYFWKLSMGNGAATRILLKADRVANAIKGSKPFVLDISKLSANINTDTILIPLSVIDSINSRNKSIVIRAEEAEYTIRPGTIKPDSMQNIKSLKDKSGVKNIIIELSISRLATQPSDTPGGMKPASCLNDMKINAVGTGKTDSEIRTMIHDKLYDSETGLVSKKLGILLGAGYTTNSAAVLDEQVDELTGLIEYELSNYIQTSVDSMKIYGAQAAVKTFGSPARAKLENNGADGVKIPYVQYSDSTVWKKLTKYTASSGAVAFDITGTGKLLLLAGTEQAADVDAGYWADSEIKSFMDKYDLSDIFDGLPGNFEPDEKVSAKEIILIYQKVLGKSGGSGGDDIKQIAKSEGLDSFFNLNALAGNVKRQEAASLIVKAYGLKTGINPASYRTVKNIDIKDDSQVAGRYYAFVVVAVDTGIFTVDSKGNFSPAVPMTRAEVITAFTRMLKLVGEL